MQDFGEPVPNWTPPPRPGSVPLVGRYVRLDILKTDHAAALHAANMQDADGEIWNYLPYGPFATADAYAEWVADVAGQDDPQFYTVTPLSTGQPSGVASYLRIAPEAGSIEVGHINFAPALQRTPAATEAIVLMIQWAFDAGYRRFEWKCNALNARSRAAAIRYGLSFEGVFRQAAVIKGRNRDTAWFAAVDKEWPRLREAFEAWLAPENFLADGTQRCALRDLTASVIVNDDTVHK